MFICLKKFRKALYRMKLAMLWGFGMNSPDRIGTRKRFHLALNIQAGSSIV